MEGKKTVTKRTRSTKKGDLLKSLNKLFNIYFLQFMVYTVCLLIIGLFLIFKPDVATRTAELVTAISLIVVGLGLIFDHTFKNKIALFDFSFVFGAITMILGVLIITNPFALTNFLAVGFGVFMIINGLSKIYTALSFKRIKESSWMLILTMSLISIVFGIIIIVNPFANLYFTQVIGVFMTLYAVIEATYTILLKQRSSEFLKILK